ncbi:T9SS type A sorting domain-containing protein [Danxiaibacter flavus]|uniref:T9SS type A sorting domain-containing protein n=1 Tax=Danxiaibacter flavus TaxID=3049108 RepID=A0ABV3ZJF6_9BACT|nr:T9SS type A sorting domain-containing protein [Chitinophagaceae bacterium DXS]
MKSILYTSLCCFISCVLFGQNKPIVQWQHRYGGQANEYLNSTIMSHDSGFLMVGSTFSHNNSDVSGGHTGYEPFLDAWVVKTDSQGNLEWEKSLGGIKPDDISQIIANTDGGYTILGSTSSNDGDAAGFHGGAYMDFWLAKLDSEGSVVWKKCLGGSKSDVGRCIKQTNDGGFVMMGFTNSNDGDVSGLHGNSGFSDIWVVKVDNTGQLQWQKCLGGRSQEDANALELTQDGGFLIAGTTNSNDGDVAGNHDPSGFYGDGWLVKLSSTGQLEWQKCIGGGFDEKVGQLKATADGNYILVGSTNSSNGDISDKRFSGYDYMVLKLAPNGNILWEKTYGGNSLTIYQNGDHATSVCLTRDGGYLVGGHSWSNDGDVSGHHGATTTTDIWLVKLDGQGLLQWQQSYGGSENDLARDIFETADSGYVVSSASESPNGDASNSRGKFDYWIMKINTPRISVSSSPTNICDYDRPGLLATVANGGPNSFVRWVRNGKFTAVTTNYWIPANMKNNDTIWAVYMTKHGQYESNKIVYKVDRILRAVVEVIPDHINSICKGTPVVFTAQTLRISSTATYQWKKNGIVVGENSITYRDDSLLNGDQVTCSVIMNYHCAIPAIATSKPVVCKVFDSIPPPLSEISGPAFLQKGALGVFSVSPSYPDGLYAWLIPQNAGIISGKGTNSVVVKWGDTTAKISVKLYNACGAPPVKTKTVFIQTPEMSSSRVAGIADQSNTFRLYPNPAKSTVTVEFVSSAADEYTLSVLSMNGVEVYKEKVVPIKGMISVRLDVSRYPVGLYTIRLFNKLSSSEKKLMVGSD